MGPLVLGIDPALRHTGWALVELIAMDLGPGYRVIEMGVIATKKSDKKRGIRVADDDHRCVEVIATGLLRAVSGRCIAAMAAESPGGHRGQRAAKLAAFATATAGTLAVVWGVPYLQANPFDIKLATAGSAKASKAMVQSALLHDPAIDGTEAYRLLNLEVPEEQHEHAFDALGAVLACEPSQAIKMARRMGGAAA